MEVCGEFGKRYVVRGLGSWKKLEKGLEREFNQITKGIFHFILQAKGWGTLEVLNRELLKSFNKITLKPR